MKLVGKDVVYPESDQYLKVYPKGHATSSHGSVRTCGRTVGLKKDDSLWIASSNCIDGVIEFDFCVCWVFFYGRSTRTAKEKNIVATCGQCYICFHLSIGEGHDVYAVRFNIRIPSCIKLWEQTKLFEHGLCIFFVRSSGQYLK